MTMTLTSRVRLQPSNEEERESVRAELREILRMPHFTTSKRYPAFLKYVVEKSLEGHAEDLKERTLGVEVFHRKSDYDTNSDTIVRFAAGEVRKRLALVYHESDIERPVQIMLSPGSYAPEFFVLPRAEAESLPALGPPPVLARATGSALGATPAWSPAEAATGTGTRVTRRRGAAWIWSAAVAGLILMGLLLGFFEAKRSAREQTVVDQFWQPVTASPNPAILSAGASVFSAATGGATSASKGDDYPYVSMATAGAVASLAEMFGRKNLRYVLRPASETTLADLREHPVILLGAYNNAWTPRMMETLRFRFSPTPVVEIYDSTNPSQVWHRPLGAPYNSAIDYAIVARYRDPVTNGVVVVLAGVGKNGTEAAAQFVTTNSYLEMLNQPQTKDWQTRNVEVVLKTTVIDGKTGAPTIEAAYVW